MFSEWNGYKRLDFEFSGREAILVFPKDGKDNRKWLLKTEYFGAFPELELAMLDRGYHLAYLKNRSRWGTDDDQSAKRDFAEYLHETYGICRRCICIGMSCGGFHAVCFASRYPSYVSMLYLDAPLLSFCAWSSECPDKEVWKREQMEAYGFSSDAQMRVYNDQPVHRLPMLAENRIPIALVYGDADSIVDPSENACVLANYYKAYGAPMRVWIKHGCDHHPHGPQNISEVIEYIEKEAL